MIGPTSSVPAWLQAALLTFALGTIVPVVPARSNPCPPSFQAIHDFRVGDVFEYRIEHGFLLAGGIRIITQQKKIRIVAKEGTPQARIYRVHELLRERDSMPNRAVRIRSGAYDTALTFLDSASHPANACPGDILPMPFPGSGRTEVEAGEGDSSRSSLAIPIEGLRWKAIGKEVIRPGDPIADGPKPYWFYVEGLGLVHHRVSYLGLPPRKEILAGYLRNGVIHGTLTPDEDFTTALRGEPATSHPILREFSWPWALGEAAFDIRGRRLPGQATVQIAP